MISGEDMRKLVTVKQSDLITNEKNILYKGYIELLNTMDGITLEYLENDKSTKVRITFDDEQMHLLRQGDMITDLCFREHEKTKGSITSSYGVMDLEVYTHKYIRKDSIIAIEYDILTNDEVVSKFRMICMLKEDIA